MTYRRAAVLGIVCVAAAGCAVTFAKRSPWDIQQLAELSDQLEQFKTLARLKAQEADELRRAKALLEERLDASSVSVGYDERGLVARMLDRVLFDSGKAVLRGSARNVLGQIAHAIQAVPNQPIGIEGHTDNEPIRHSGWADNKALSQARAQAVADHLIQQHGIDPARLTVIGYGEERPVAANDTSDGRRQNRRVEIIILPRASESAYEAEAKRVRSDAGYAK